MIREKTMHQIWIGPKKIPLVWMETWKQKHPTWNFILWDNERVKKYPFINKDKIEDLSSRGLYNGAADIITYEVLYNYGGFVAQADSICLNPINELMNIEEDCFTCYENEQTKGKRLAMILASSKNCRLMWELTEFLRGRTKIIIKPFLSTGNKFLTQQVERLQYPIKIYPSYYFLPTHCGGIKYEGTGKIYSEHIWGTTKNLYE